MSKRKNKDDGSVGFGYILYIYIAIMFILALLSTALIGATIIAPLVLCVYWLFCESKVLNLRKYETISDLSATPEEIEIIKKRDNKINALRNEISLLEDSIHALKEKGSHLTERNDGLFDERSHLGKELNIEINSIKQKILTKEMSIYECSRENDIEDRVEHRQYNWANIISNRSISRLALPLYVSAFALLNILSPTWLSDNILMNAGFDFFDIGKNNRIFIGASFVSAIIVVCFVYLIKSPLRRNLLAERGLQATSKPLFVLSSLSVIACIYIFAMPFLSNSKEKPIITTLKENPKENLEVNENKVPQKELPSKEINFKDACTRGNSSTLDLLVCNNMKLLKLERESSIRYLKEQAAMGREQNIIDAEYTKWLESRNKICKWDPFTEITESEQTRLSNCLEKFYQ